MPIKSKILGPLYAKSSRVLAVLPFFMKRSNRIFCSLFADKFDAVTGSSEALRKLLPDAIFACVSCICSLILPKFLVACALNNFVLTSIFYLILSQLVFEKALVLFVKFLTMPDKPAGTRLELRLGCQG